MADLTDFVNRKCFLHMCEHQKVVSNKVRIRSVQLFFYRIGEIANLVLYRIECDLDLNIKSPKIFIYFMDNK